MSAAYTVIPLVDRDRVYHASHSNFGMMLFTFQWPFVMAVQVLQLEIHAKNVVLSVAFRSSKAGAEDE